MDIMIFFNVNITHRWKSPFDRKKFCNFVRSLISKAIKSNFLTNLVTESSNRTRTLWKTLNSILHRNPFMQFFPCPWHTYLTHLPIHSCNFLMTIERIRSKFSLSDSQIPFFFQSSLLQIYLISIQPLSRKFKIFSKQCVLFIGARLNSYFPFETLLQTNLALLSLIS